MGSYSQKRYPTESSDFPTTSTTRASKAFTFTNITDLPSSSAVIGDQAFVSSNLTQYMWNGTGWYKIATVTNAAPSSVTGVNATYTLASDGSTPTVITAVATDPEGFSLTWSYSVTSGSLNGTTVSQGTGNYTNVFTITPHASNATTFSLTFQVTDGINAAVSAVSAFTLVFSVHNSRYTTVSAKARATSPGPVYTLSDTHSPSGQYMTLGFVAMPSNQIFTLEGWFRIDDTGAAEIWFFDQHTVGVTGRSVLGVRAGYISAFGTGGWSNGSRAFDAGDTTTYKHLAWVQNGSNTLNYYIDGVASGTHTGFGQTAQQNTTFGENTNYGSAGFSCKGFRVTNTALYTSNFTPPNIVGGLTDISGTQVLWDGSVGTATDASSNNRSLTNNGMTFASVGGQNQTFDDASASNHALTVVGDTTASTFSPHRHGGYSAHFTTAGSSSASGGTGQYIQSALTSELTLDTNDFTIDCWVYAISRLRSYPRILQIGPQHNPWGASQLAILYKHDSDNDSISLAMQGIGGNSLLIASGPINDNQWYHVAVTRSGSTFTLYIDGVSAGTYTSSGSATGTGNKAIQIGSASSGDSDFHGYIFDVRVINGTSIYAGNFTPPTEPATVVANTKFLLGRLPYLKDQSTSNHAMTFTGDVSFKPKSVFDNQEYSEADHGESVYFDGTDDYLTVADSTEFDFGTGNFTIEGWINPTVADNSYKTIFSIGAPVQIYSYNSNLIAFFNDGDNTSSYTINGLTGPSSSVSANTWAHFAVVRDGNTYTIYVNGVAGSSLTSSDTVASSSSAPAIGTYLPSPSTYEFSGYISDFRIVKGTAVYAGNFTPPTAPLTAITNTKFLLNPDVSISDLSQSTEIKCFGGAVTSTAQVKFAGTKSIYGDGSGDYVSMSIEPIGTDDFTIEAWIYPTNLGTYATAISGATIGGGKGAVFGVDLWFVGNNSSNQLFSSAANKIVVDQWQHIAITRQGTSLKLFYNGTQFDSGTNSTDLDQTTYVLFARYTDGSYLEYTGYIQDFRITKGLARYTANFTPSTTELAG